MRKKILVFAVLVIAIIALILSLKLDNNSVIYDKGWYNLEQDESRAMNTQSRIYLFSRENVDNAKLAFSVYGFREDRKIEIFLNNKIIGTYVVPAAENQHIFTRLLNITKGKNTIIINSTNGCSFTDIKDRCISLFLSNFSVKKYSGFGDIEFLSESLEEPSFESGWYEPYYYNGAEYRWMKDDGNISFYNFNHQKDYIKLKLVLNSLDQRKVYLYLNEQLRGSYEMKEGINTFYTPLMNFKNGENVIELKSPCKIPLPTIWNTTWCISIDVKNITLMNSDNIKSDLSFETLIEPEYISGWYEPYYYNNMKYHWMGSEGTFSLYNINHSKDAGKIKLTVNNFLNESRDISMYINNQFIQRFTLSNGNNVIESRLLYLINGENKVELVSSDGCYVPSKLGLWNDERCISFNLQNITWVNIN